MICSLPGLDNVALIDFWGAKLPYFARILGCIIPMPSVFGDFVGYTSIPWAHYGSLESSGVDLAPKKIFYKI